MAVGDIGTIMTSPDGIVWTKQNSGTTDELNSVVYTGTQVVLLVSFGPMQMSPDGFTWKTGPMITYPSPSAIASTGSLLVAVGSFGAIQTSQERPASLSPYRNPGWEFFPAHD